LGDAAANGARRLIGRDIAGVTRDFRGRQIVSGKGHKKQLEVSRSYLGLFKGM
jgi:hypothetical protein